MGEWRMRVRDGGSGDSEAGLVMKKMRKKIDDRYRCQPHPGLQR